MKYSTLISSAVVSAGLIFVAAHPAKADDNDKDKDNNNRIDVKLSGFNENPLALSSPATAQFNAKIDRFAQTITYELSYKDFPAPAVNPPATNPTQSHIHFGSRSQSGGISVFLCSNLGNGPA